MEQIIIEVEQSREEKRKDRVTAYEKMVRKHTEHSSKEEK